MAPERAAWEAGHALHPVLIARGADRTKTTSVIRAKKNPYKSST